MYPRLVLIRYGKACRHRNGSWRQKLLLTVPWKYEAQHTMQGHMEKHQGQ